jgi:hypothetical protein
MKNLSARNYFLRSPFRSVSFTSQTILLVIFILWGIRKIRLEETVAPCTSNAILGLMVLPVVVWVYSLFLHREIGSLIAFGEEASSVAQLARLQRNILLVVILMAEIILLALTSLCSTGAR